MKCDEIRRVVAGHLAAKGYVPEQASWEPRKPQLNLLVGDSLSTFRFPTKASKKSRLVELARIPGRGPARLMPVDVRGARDDGYRQTDLIEWLGQSEQR